MVQFELSQGGEIIGSGGQWSLILMDTKIYVWKSPLSMSREYYLNIQNTFAAARGEPV